MRKIWSPNSVLRTVFLSGEGGAQKEAIVQCENTLLQVKAMHWKTYERTFETRVIKVLYYAKNKTLNRKLKTENNNLNKRTVQEGGSHNYRCSVAFGFKSLGQLKGSENLGDLPGDTVILKYKVGPANVVVYRWLKMFLHCLGDRCRLTNTGVMHALHCALDKWVEPRHRRVIRVGQQWITIFQMGGDKNTNDCIFSR